MLCLNNQKKNYSSPFAQLSKPKMQADSSSFMSAPITVGEGSEWVSVDFFLFARTTIAHSHAHTHARFTNKFDLQLSVSGCENACNPVVGIFVSNKLMGRTGTNFSGCILIASQQTHFVAHNSKVMHHARALICAKEERKSNYIEEDTYEFLYMQNG